MDQSDCRVISIQAVLIRIEREVLTFWAACSHLASSTVGGQRRYNTSFMNVSVKKVQWKRYSENGTVKMVQRKGYSEKDTVKKK